MVIFHLIINNSCNLCCKYCGELAFDKKINSNYCNFPEVDESLPEEMAFNVSDLVSFLKKYNNPVLVFYGGEPLLSYTKIEDIVKAIDFPCTYVIQTNGLLLDKISSTILNNFSTILVSIDGCKETTDYFRGVGTYDKLVQNIKFILKNGYKGNIIARMTLMEPISFYDEVMYLLNNKDYCFKEIHWQLNANFYPDFKFRKFKLWSKTYFSDLKKLYSFWLDELQKGNVIKLYPFLGITKRLIDLENNKDFEGYYLPCGAGHYGFGIQTDGNIVPCPIMVGMYTYYIGNIFSKITEKELMHKSIKPSGCDLCKYYSICGGRCLYSNITKPWDKQDYDFLCDLTKKTIDVVTNGYNTRIKQFIFEKKLCVDDFSYKEYIGPEIIP